MKSLLNNARVKYHNKLIEDSVLTIDNNGVASNADKSSKLSIAIAQNIAKQLNAAYCKKTIGQTSGAKFEDANMLFLMETFPRLQSLRPGKWHILRLGNKNTLKISSFVQYEHLDYLTQLTKADPQLAAYMGNDYLISPDVVIYRDPEDDDSINASDLIVSHNVCNYSELRLNNNNNPILHASISAKWTMRSDRAQNSRTEALNLVRNRKGRLPHIVVVTAEPLPSRIASLALGTGDIDCVYHFALYELVKAVKESKAEDSIELLKILINGKRLKDISDLPLDLCV